MNLRDTPKEAVKNQGEAAGTANSRAGTKNRRARRPRRSLLKGGSRPVSRVLSRMVIPLGRTSPPASSGLPGSRVRATRAHSAPAPLFGLAPGGVYLATNRCRPCGALLPHLFTLTCAPEGAIGGLFSAALSVGSRPPGITWHPALWSPDFPPRQARRPSSRLPATILIGFAFAGNGVNCPQNRSLVRSGLQLHEPSIKNIAATAGDLGRHGSGLAWGQTSAQRA